MASSSPSSFGGPYALLALFGVFLCFYCANVNGRVPADLARNKKFAKCCTHTRLFSAKAVKSMCHYLPGGGEIPPMDVREEISAHLDAYIGCYTAHQNNTQCCYDNGVKGEYFDVCRDFCCGGTKSCPRHKPQSKYYACVSKVKQIAQCNKVAWDKVAPVEPIKGHSSENGTDK